MPPADKNRDTQAILDRDYIPAEEVERIVEDKVEQARVVFAAQMAQQLEEFKKSFSPGMVSSLTDNGALEALATAISAATDRDHGKVHVPPEEVAKRVRAREAMEALILRTFDAGGEAPAYNLTQKCYLGEKHISPMWADVATRTTKATEIGWWDVPNEFMHPVNEKARAIHALFLDSIGGVKKRGENLRITPGGLTVRSGGLDPQGGHGPAPRVGRDIHQPEIVGRNGERSSIVTRILGTLMPPAEQMV